MDRRTANWVARLTVLAALLGGAGCEDAARENGLEHCRSACRVVEQCAGEAEFDRAACDAACARTLVMDADYLRCLIDVGLTRCTDGVNSFTRYCGSDDVLLPARPMAL